MKHIQHAQQTFILPEYTIMNHCDVTKLYLIFITFITNYISQHSAYMADY
jgi:hypothetical protein